MSYIINKTNGQLLLTLLDGTADGPAINPGLNTTDVNLFGKNYPAFGEYLNENFVRLLENFSNANAPTRPIKGQLWYDSSIDRLKVYTGTQFRTVSPISVGPIAPSIVSYSGDQWWDTYNDQLKSFNGTSWTTIGPAYSKQDGISGAIVETVYDVSEKPHTVVKMYTNGNVSSISSYDPSFTPNVAISGFTSINPGITLNSSNYNNLVHGTATNSQMLGNITAAQYARKDISETFASNIQIAGGATTLTSIGVDTRLTSTTLNSNVAIYTNVNGISTNTLNIDGTTGLITVVGDPIANNGVANKNYVDTTIASTAALLAPLFSATLSGTPTSTTPPATDSTTRIATTEFTQAAIAANDNAHWQGSGKTVSTSLPTIFDGEVGDFWFQI